MPAAEAGALFHSLDREPVLALAVSGGSDSLALLHLAVQHFGPARCFALTVDHGLRPGSAREAFQVAMWCENLGVAHHVLHWQGPKPPTGIQAKARKARYDLMTEKCHALGIPVLLTAHTRDDQAETVAMRKHRTSSQRSLAGIWPETEWDGVRIVRPLLSETRSDLRDVLNQLGIAWLDDPSNENRAFERVRVRQALAGQDSAALAGEAASARETVLAERRRAQAWLRENAKVEATGLLRLPRAGLRELAAGAALEACDVMIRAAGSGKAPERAALEAVLHMAVGHEAGRMTVAGALVACRKREVLLGREPGRIDPVPIAIPASGQLLWDARFLVSGPQGARVSPAGAKCPKSDPAVPAFVLAGLPQVDLPDGTTVLPHLSASPKVAVGLSERFVL